MADADVQLSKTHSKTPSNTFTKASSKVTSKEKESALNLSPTDMTFSAEGRKSKAQTPSMSVPPKTTSVTLNTEVLSVLKELNVNLSKQRNHLETVAQRVDELYEMNGYEPHEGYSEENEENVPEMGEYCSSEPPLKKQCSEIDIFKNLCDKYQATEKCDSEINDNLAAFINNSFRNGVSEETLCDILKDIHRPSNCEALVKTKVNACTCMWRLLKPQTQSEDVKFQTMQNILVKATSNIAKPLDKESSNMDSQSLKWGTNAVALLGQSYKLINNKLKECHRADLDPRFYPLTSSSQPYTDNLYGDDINKNVRDIQDMSKLGKDVGRSQFPQNQNRGGFYRRRGGRRGQSRGRGRGFPPKQDAAGAQPKDFRGGYKKQF